MFFLLLPFGFLLFMVVFFSLARGRFLQRRQGGEETEQEHAHEERRERQGLPRRWLPLRAAARPADPEARVFRLANRRKGRLMVSDVVIDLGLSIRQAEELLDGLVDGRRVRLEATPNGLSVYEFPEILSRLPRS
jgi:hypothetical protein